MREICFGGALCFLVAAMLVRGRQERLHAKPPATQAPETQTATPPSFPAPPDDPPAPPAASVTYTGEDSWTVFLPADQAWFNSRIPVGPQYQVWIEPSEPTADCQFQLKVGSQVYSSEIVAENGAPDTQRIRRVFPWSETPTDVPIWVEPVQLKLAPSCRREGLTLDIESASLLEPDDPLFQQEYAEQRQRVLASQAAAWYLQHLFESKGEKK